MFLTKPTDVLVGRLKMHARLVSRLRRLYTAPDKRYAAWLLRMLRWPYG